MQVIVLASSKGGSTKSTLSAELAIAAERAGSGPVALVDLDPQASTEHWCNARQADTPVIAEVMVSRLSTDLAALHDQGFETVIIDTPGYSTVAMDDVVACANLIVVPVRATVDDLRTVARTIAPINTADVPFVFVLTGATPRARVTDAAGRELAQHGLVAPVVIHHRLSVPAARMEGLSVSETEPESKAAEEYSQLWTWISTRLARSPTQKSRTKPHLRIAV